jgi:hypothetical protein
MQYINVYTMEYFNTTVIEKPELLQTWDFNKKIVQYRAESIYKTMNPDIRPNAVLNQKIWDAIHKRNEANREARKYFRREINFTTL